MWRDRHTVPRSLKFYPKAEIRNVCMRVIYWEYPVPVLVLYVLNSLRMVLGAYSTQRSHRQSRVCKPCIVYNITIVYGSE